MVVYVLVINLTIVSGRTGSYQVAHSKFKVEQGQIIPAPVHCVAITVYENLGWPGTVKFLVFYRELLSKEVITGLFMYLPIHTVYTTIRHNRNTAWRASQPATGSHTKAKHVLLEVFPKSVC